MKNRNVRILLLSFIGFFIVSPAFAIPPVVLSGPVPALANSYVSDTTTTITYTISNYVPKPLPLTLKGFLSTVTRTTVANDCGDELPASHLTTPSTCKIGINIAPTSNDGGTSVSTTLLMDYQGRLPLSAPISFSVHDAFLGRLPAVGSGNVGAGNFPLLAVSQVGGQSWSVQPITGIPTNGVLYSTICSGSGSSAICAAAGVDKTGADAPLLVASLDGGQHWAVQSVTGLPSTGDFFSTDCVGTGSSAICAAVGDTSGSPRFPLLVVTTDGGVHWAVQTIALTLTQGSFESTDCNGSGATALCLATGVKVVGVDYFPLLVASQDGGQNWTEQTITDPQPNTKGKLVSGSCTGRSGSSPAICTVVGVDISSGGEVPLLITSQDGGLNWVRRPLINLPITGLFWGVNCTGEGNSAICVAVGQDESGTQPPFLIVSRDGAQSWTAPTLTGLPDNGTFYAVSCTGSNNNGVCIAVGLDLTNSAPILAVSTDGGITWGFPAIAGVPALSGFAGAFCTGSGSSAICTATGTTFDGTQPPLLAESLDGGQTWSVQAIENLPDSGVFYGSGRKE